MLHAAARSNLGVGFVFPMAVVLYFLVVPPAFAGSLSEQFPSTGNYPTGTLVAIQQEDSSKVDLADINNTDFLVGVVEDQGTSLISISREAGDLHVALSGEVEVFVSDINGDIQEGDFIGSSWIRGVGMVSLGDPQQKLLGVALQSFDETTSDVVVVNDIETPSGSKTARITKIGVRLFDRDVGVNPNQETTSQLEKFAERIAGKDVVFARVVAAVVLFIVTGLIGGAFLANAIRGSFISLGRNPLASSSIYVNLIQVSAVSIGVMLIGTVLSYVVLTL